MAVNLRRAWPPARPPSSREINLAIAMLKEAGADAQAIRLLEIWNAHRLVEAAQRVGTHEELAYLFAGLPNSPVKTDTNIPE